jgi:hypothetical protein
MVNANDCAQARCPGDGGDGGHTVNNWRMADDR